MTGKRGNAGQPGVPGSGVTKKRRLNMLRLYNVKGWTMQQIADQYGMSPHQVRAILNRAGVRKSTDQ